MQGKFPLVLVVNSQPGFALVLDLYQYEYVRLLKPTPAAQAFPTQSPAAAAHALHTLPCFSALICERDISVKVADLFPSSEEAVLWNNLT